MARVFVGNVGRDIRERDLEKFFRDNGRIREVMMKDGFAFVEFEDFRDADDAVRDLDGRDCYGSRLRVEHSKPRSRGRGRGFGGGFGGDRGSRYGDRGGGGDSGGRFAAPTRTKYQCRVENVSSSVSWQDLKDFCRAAGDVTYAEAHRQEKNEGVVCFATERDMKSAMEKLEGKDLNGRNLKFISEYKGGGSDRSRSRSRNRSRSRDRSRSPRRSRSRSPRRRRSRSRSSGSRDSRSQSPPRRPANGANKRSGSRSPARRPANGADKQSGSRSPPPRRPANGAERHSSSGSPPPARRAD